jgi:hypothetical protein
MDAGYGTEKTLAIVGWETPECGPVGFNALEQLGRGADAIEELGPAAVCG